MTVRLWCGYSVIGPPTPTHWWCVWLVVGLGVDRIVDASRLLFHSPPTARGVWRVLGVLLFVLAY